MRHENPTIDSILNADAELQELEDAWFVSLSEFYETYDNKGSAESLNLAARNVRSRKSDYNLAAAQTIAMLEHAFEFIRSGHTCWRECCLPDAPTPDEVRMALDPLGVMDPDIIF